MKSLETPHDIKKKQNCDANCDGFSIESFQAHQNIFTCKTFKTKKSFTCKDKNRHQWKANDGEKNEVA